MKVTSSDNQVQSCGYLLCDFGQLQNPDVCISAATDKVSKSPRFCMQHVLHLRTNDQDRVKRAWPYIYSNGCTGK
jgi:hypothetical protein